MRYNLPCGRLRYDINPFTLERAYRIEDISHAARVYRKSRKGFISLRSVLKGTTLTDGSLFLHIVVYKSVVFLVIKRFELRDCFFEITNSVLNDCGVRHIDFGEL